LGAFGKGLLGFVLERVPEEDGTVGEGGEVGAGINAGTHDAEIVH